MKHARQMSESIELGIVLAMAGGFMDAYSYICRDHVFANAQTGNILLLGISISERNWSTAIRYAFPVLAFTMGILLSDVVKIKWKETSLFHWRQISVLLEALLLLCVCFIPQEFNLEANSLTSFACGIQVESFRKIRGNGVATTMCIGNLRSATQNICEYFFTKKKEGLKKGLLYYGIILCFVLGAVIGNCFIKIWKEKALIICCGLLFLAFLMMFVNRGQMEE